VLATGLKSRATIARKDLDDASALPIEVVESAVVVDALIEVFMRLSVSAPRTLAKVS